MQVQVTANEIIVVLGVLGLLGVAASLTTQITKKVLKLESNPLIRTVALTFSTGFAYLQYHQTILAHLPPEVMGISTVGIFGLSQGVFGFSKDAKAWLSQYNLFVRKLDNAAAATTPPATTTPEDASKPAKF